MRVLFLSPWFPFPPENGTKTRVCHLLRALAKEHQVSLLAFVRPGEHVDPSGLEGLCCAIDTLPWREFAPVRARALLGFVSPWPRAIADTYDFQADRLIHTRIERGSPDIIVASELGTARYVARRSSVPRVIDDLQLAVAHDAWAEAASLLLRWRRALTWTKCRHYTGAIVRRFDACTVVSERERALLGQVVPDYAPVSVIPNGVDVAALQAIRVEPQPNTLIYNGALTYSANYDAMRYFLESIFPLVRAQKPQTRLEITGSTHGANVAALPLDNQVTLTGYLGDVRAAVARAWVCVVPLRVGGGTRLKILEAMALGTPVVATSKGAEGLDVQHGQHLLVADTPEEFADAVLRLFREPGLRGFLAERARQRVAERYDWRVITPRFLEAVNRVGLQEASKDGQR